MADESRVMDVDGALRQQEWTPDEFAGVLYKFTEMTKEIREMKSSKRIAMFQVDAKQFAKSTLPFPQVIFTDAFCVESGSCVIKIRRTDAI